MGFSNDEKKQIISEFLAEIEKDEAEIREYRLNDNIGNFRLKLLTLIGTLISILIC